MSPRKIEMIAGGASFAPSRWSLPALAMLARSSPCHLLTARSTAAQNTRNCMLSCGFAPGLQQVVPLVVAHRPVEVLARSVDAGKRLLVQQAGEPVLRRRPPHRLHRHHLMIGGEVGVLEHRRDLVLARRHFVVARLHRHADLVELGFDLRHERHHAIGDRAEVLIFELLALRRLGAEQRPAGVDEIRAATGRSSGRSGSIPARGRRS